jgi:hypothetical protein
MKSVVFSIPYGMAFRNVVCCGVIATVMTKGWHPTVLLPHLATSDAGAVGKELPAGARIGELLPVRAGPVLQVLKATKQYLYSRRVGTDSFQIKYRRRRVERPLFHRAAVVMEMLAGYALSEQMVDRMLRMVPQAHEEHYRRVLDDIRPRAVVIMKPGYQPEDLPLIKAARAAKLPVMSIDTTWDNMVSKRPAYLRPDAITLWNEQMARDASSLYGFADDQAVVTGGPQFDIFFDRSRLPDRTEFLRSLGLDPSRQLVLLTLGHPMYTPDNAHYIRLLLESIHDGSIHGKPSLVVRIHPWDRWSDYEKGAEGYANVRIERPFGLSASESVFECVPTTADVERYGGLMAYADVLINVASTTSLDAVATDTPTVSLAFDMVSTHPDRSVSRLNEFTHYKPIVESRAVRVCHSQDDLFAVLNMYLADRDCDRDLRAAARRRFLTFDDGQNAERVARAIADLA